jgi:uncharacterized protein (TIGR00369 family)
MISLDREECVYEYDVDPEHFNPTGILHGGALFTVMDSSQGMFVLSLVDGEYPSAATGTATVKYLAPVRSGRITIRTRLVERQGRKIFVRSEARSADGTVVATLDEIWIAISPKVDA